MFGSVKAGGLVVIEGHLNGIAFTSISAIHNRWTIAPPPSISDNPAHVYSNSTHVKMSKLLFFEEAHNSKKFPKKF